MGNTCKSGKAAAMILSMAYVLCFANAFAEKGDLNIIVRNIRSEAGLIRLALYNHSDQFPHDPGRKFQFTKKLDPGGNLNIRLSGIPYGTYAISILDDEDSNDRMKFSILRVPREGFGFSNNVKPGLKSPGFEECAFTLKDEEIQLEIEIQYYLENPG